MSLGRLAAKNVWQNRGRYLAYWGSAAFSVMIYFLYTALAVHPRLQGGFAGAQSVAEVMQAAAVVIAIFTLLFLLYSERGVHPLPHERIRAAVVARAHPRTTGPHGRLGKPHDRGDGHGRGHRVGTALFEAVFHGHRALLQLPAQLPVYLGWPVWRRTLLVFGSIFMFVSLLSLRGVLRRNIIELLRAGRKPLERPTFSKGKALLGAVLVGAGYVWASVPVPTAVVLGVVPVTTMVSIGTYFLLRETSVALLQGLRRVQPLYGRPGPFLTVNQLTFKLQENYRVLSGAAILVAVILSAMGTILAIYVVAEEAALSERAAGDPAGTSRRRGGVGARGLRRRHAGRARRGRIAADSYAAAPGDRGEHPGDGRAVFPVRTAVQAGRTDAAAGRRRPRRAGQAVFRLR